MGVSSLSFYYCQCTNNVDICVSLSDKHILLLLWRLPPYTIRSRGTEGHGLVVALAALG